MKRANLNLNTAHMCAPAKWGGSLRSRQQEEKTALPCRIGVGGLWAVEKLYISPGAARAHCSQSRLKPLDRVLHSHGLNGTPKTLGKG